MFGNTGKFTQTKKHRRKLDNPKTDMKIKKEMFQDTTSAQKNVRRKWEKKGKYR